MNIVIALVVALLSAVLASQVAEPATLLAVDAMLAIKVVGFTTAIVVQIVRDGAVLVCIALLGAAFAYVHRMSMLGFLALAALLIAAIEPLFSARIDTVAAAWGSFRVVGRLSAVTFALTFASYLDTLVDKPRGLLRSGARFLISMCFIALAHAVSGIVPARRLLSALTRSIGLTIIIDDAEAGDAWVSATGYTSDARSAIQRLAVATIVPDQVPLPPLRLLLSVPQLVLGSEPRTTFLVRREPTRNAAFDAFMPARIEIEPRPLVSTS